MPLFEPMRYKVYHGGRGGAKSWSFAKALVILAMQGKERILCVREFQNSIADSVHQVIKTQITNMGLGPFFHITDKSIVCTITGSEFLFKGLRHNSIEIKSTEGITRCWVEEAQRVSKESWDFLIPTIRGRTPKGTQAEIWVSFNLEDDNSATAQRFLGKTKYKSAIIAKVNYDSNPYFPQVLEDERQALLAADPDAHDHVYLGFAKKITDAQIFQKKVIIQSFETPAVGLLEGKRFFFGADFGFANDPSTLIRFFIKDDCLWIDHEWFGYGVEIDQMFSTDPVKDHPRGYDLVPESRNWPIKGDCSRPETISFLMRHGFRISAAEKWNGSVEDGISHIKGFKKIYIHERCPRIAQEARLYSYKVDQRQLDDKGQPVILPVVVDAHNHGWDAVRYGLDGYIQKRGALGVWEKLGRMT